MTSASHFSPSPSLTLAQARHTGGIVFFAGAALQGFILLVIFGCFAILAYMYKGRDFDDSHTLQGFVEHLLEPDSHLLPALVAIVTLVGATWPLGMWAGKAIGIQRRRYGWVALRVLVIPAFLASLVFCLGVMALNEEIRIQAEQDIVGQFLVPILLFAGVAFVIGILTGMLSGLVVRQRLRVLEERARMESMVAQHTDEA